MMGSAILDWPEHTQTSPTRISFSLIWLIPLTSMIYGPPAFRGFSRTDHSLSSPVMALTFSPSNCTVIFSPGAAQPQIFMGTPLCNTMPSLTRRGSLTCPATACQPNKMQPVNRRTIIFLYNIHQIDIKTSECKKDRTGKQIRPAPDLNKTATLL